MEEWNSKRSRQWLHTWIHPFPNTGMKFRLGFEEMELLGELSLPQDTHAAPSAMLTALAGAKWFILGWKQEILNLQRLVGGGW